MKTKKELIEYINKTAGVGLTNSNTSYSKINKSKEVWWFNVKLDKFTQEVHLLLNQENSCIWLCLPKGFVASLGSTFKIREDKNAIDLEISSDKSYKCMLDVKSGGTHFNFAPFVKGEITF